MQFSFSKTQRQRSKALTSELVQRIATQGPIDFATFMATCLYHPTFGYYTNQEEVIGKQGDFITAPELTSQFGHTIAKSLASILPYLQRPKIIEVGAGNGSLAASILTHLDRLQFVPHEYIIVEISPSLQQKQKDLLIKLPLQLYQRIQWLNEIPDNFEGIILANELLDALPIDIYHWYHERLFKISVDWQDNRFVWVPLTETSIPEHIKTLAENLPDDYWIEDHKNAINWLTNAAKKLTKGAILLFDYGYEQKQYYHPDRNRGTLSTFLQHTTGHDPLTYPGLQDLSCHVNFTALQQTAVAQGLQIAGFTTQANFLLKAGMSFPDNLSVEATYTLAQAFKKLLMPSEMGEIVKVLALTKDFEGPILGF